MGIVDSDAADTVTVNHGWTGGPLVIMSKYLAGIKPLTPNYEEYEIIPQLGLGALSASVTTNKGDIKLSIEDSEEQTVIRITAIEGLGIIKLPIELKQKLYNSSNGFIETPDDKYYSLSFGAGEYELVFNK